MARCETVHYLWFYSFWQRCCTTLIYQLSSLCITVAIMTLIGKLHRCSDVCARPKFKGIIKLVFNQMSSSPKVADVLIWSREEQHHQKLSAHKCKKQLDGCGLRQEVDYFAFFKCQSKNKKRHTMHLLFNLTLSA